jgi:hypothetical protein
MVGYFRRSAAMSGAFLLTGFKLVYSVAAVFGKKFI